MARFAQIHSDLVRSEIAAEQNRTAVFRFPSQVADYQRAIPATGGCFVRKCPVFESTTEPRRSTETSPIAKKLNKPETRIFTNCHQLIGLQGARLHICLVPVGPG